MPLNKRLKKRDSYRIAKNEGGVVVLRKSLNTVETRGKESEITTNENLFMKESLVTTKTGAVVIQTIPALSNVLKTVDSASINNSYLLGFGSDNVF